MKILHLTLKKKWFDMIVSGEKEEEYREIKKYWANRLGGSNEYRGNDKGLLPNDKTTYWNGFYPIKLRYFDAVKFTNGYGKHCPTTTFECLGIDIGMPNPAWCEPEDEGKYCFIIKLGKRLD